MLLTQFPRFITTDIIVHIAMIFELVQFVLVYLCLSENLTYGDAEGGTDWNLAQAKVPVLDNSFDIYLKLPFIAYERTFVSVKILSSYSPSIL